MAMLVLERKTNESVYIGDNIHVTVVEIRGDKVRLGFDAPREIPIHRDEIYQRIQEARKRHEHSRTESSTVISERRVDP